MKRLGTVLAVGAILVASIAPAWAGGVSGSPGTIDIPDALRGSTLFRVVKLTNNTGVDTPFQIDFEGEAASWMKLLDPEDRTTEISELLDSDGSGAIGMLRIDVPDGVANGRYIGTLRARLAPPETETGVGVGLGVKLRVTLDVNGDQVIAGAFQDVSLTDTEVGVPARVMASIRNDGNIQIKPEFTLEIFDDGVSISKTTTASNIAYPGETKTFEVVWDTSSAQAGEYTAMLSVDFGGVDLGTERRDFTVYPAGTLSQVASLISLELDSEPETGGFARLTATIENPGQIETFVIVVGELTRNGESVSQFESLDYLVRPGDTLPLPVNIEIPQDGDYAFTARVRYGDNESTPLTVTFSTGTVAEGAGVVAAPEDAGSVPAGVVGFAVLVLVALVTLGVWIVKRKANNGQSKKRPLDPDIDPDKQTATVGSED